MWFGGFFPPSRPRAARGGIKAQSPVYGAASARGLQAFLGEHETNEPEA
jgi:hypothetical protein